MAPRIEALRGKPRGARGATPLALTHLPEVIEDIDYREWVDPRNTVLKYTFLLLCHKGGSFESTRDYSSEILRLFWQVLIPGNERIHVRRFGKQYAIWCREVLGRAGLIEIEGEEMDEAVKVSSPAGTRARGAVDTPGAPFRMKASPFFSAWVGLSGYWRE